MSETRPDEYPDGSVGRYVRERWAANARAAAEERSENGAQHPGVGARRDEAWGVVPDDGSWGSDVLEIDEIEADDSTWAEAERGSAPAVPHQEAPQDQGWFQQSPPTPTHPTPPHPAPPVAPPVATHETLAPPAAGPQAQGGPALQQTPQQTPQQYNAPRSTPSNGSPGGAHPAPANGAPANGAPSNGAPSNRAPAPPVGPSPAPEPWQGAEPVAPATGGAEDHTPPTGISTPPRPIRDVGRWTDPGAVAAQEAQRSRADSDAESADLSTARLLKPSRRRPPRTGWRRFLYLLTGRLINPGESPQDVRERELVTRVNQPLLGCHKIATLSLKGGVGKTTITATLGATFASKRGDRVVAVDANPDRGTLSEKIPLETSATVRHLLRDAQRVRRYTDVRAYTSQGPSRLEVLASEQDPAVSEAFSEDDYRRTVTLLEHFYNVVLTDCGTGLMHSAMYGVLGVADQLIIVSSGSIDGARSASATMDWLEAHHHGDLVRNAIAVINNVHRQAGAVDLDQVAKHFAGRCRAVVQIPFDPHLEEGAEVDLDRLSQPTRVALLELAAYVADGFPR